MRRKRLSPWIVTALLLAAGAALRLLFLWRYALVQTDGSLYAEIAQNWTEFHIYGFSTAALPRPTLIRLPGYPIFLVISSLLFGHWFHADSFAPVMLLQGMLDLFGCWLLAQTAANLIRPAFGDSQARRAAWLTLAAGCLCPFTANYTSTPLTEAPTVFTIALALFSLERWSHTVRASGKGFNAYLYLMSGALAASLLLRPDQALLSAAFLPAMVWMAVARSASARTAPLNEPVILSNALESRLQRRRSTPADGAVLQRRRLRAAIAPAFVALMLILLPLVPWTIRNYRTFHVFQPLAPRFANDPGEPVNRGFQRWYRTWAVDFASTEEFYWKYPDEPLNIASLPDRAFDSDAEYDQTADLIEASNDAPHHHAAIDRRFDALATQRIHADPLRYYVELPAARLANMLFHPRTEMLPYDLRWWNYQNHPKQTMYSWGFALLNLAYFVAAGFGARRGWKIAPDITAACLGYIVLRCLLLLTLDNAEQRYTIEFYPLLILWIGFLALPAQRNISQNSRVTESQRGGI